MSGTHPSFFFKNLRLGTVSEAWSKCKSSFCVDPGQIDMLILWGDGQSTFCSLHEKVIAFMCEEAIAYVIWQLTWRGLTVNISLSTWIVNPGGEGSDNYLRAKNGVATSSGKK